MPVFRPCTAPPHCIRGRYDNSPDQVRQATERLQRELQAERIRLAAKPGMEYYLDEHFPAKLENPQFLGNTRLLLAEIPSRASVDLVRENLRLFSGAGMSRCWLIPSAPVFWLMAEAARFQIG